MKRRGFDLQLECGACPQIFNIFYSEQKIGYIRVKNGRMRVNFSGDFILSVSTKGDGLLEESEENQKIDEALDAIIHAMNESEKFVRGGCHTCKTEKFLEVDNNEGSLLVKSFTFCSNCRRDTFHYYEKQP